MDTKALQDKKLAIETNFNEQSAKKQELTSQITEVDTELVKLQGEYRVITELIESNKEKDTKNAK